MARTKLVQIETIEIDVGTYPRVSRNWVTVETYFQAMKAGARFPPVVLAPFRNKLYLVDGAHRLEAWRKLGAKSVPAEVLSPVGSLQDIYIEAVKRNITNGYPFSFYEKIEVYRRLKDAGYSLAKISGILVMPPQQLQKYASDRMTNTYTGNEVVLKAPIKHLAGHLVSGKAIQDEDVFNTQTQVSIINQLITLIKNGWLNMKNDSVLEAVTELKALI